MKEAKNLIGLNLGQYQILDELGRGGMAVVYKAWQSSLRRYVALKVLLSHLDSDAEFLHRFQQEAIVAANLKHPNIVTVYEVGHDQGYLYIAMEYIEGQSLEQMITANGAMAPEYVSHILQQIAQAMDYAHQRNFVHRDIKPANIMVTPEGRAIITDFGIAKAMEGSGATAKLTAAGTIIGTPAYMSPEEIKGEPIDYRTDLYALGIVAYEMLSGRVPFEGNTTASLLYNQVNVSPPNIKQYSPYLPEVVAGVLGRMLSKNPEGRYPSAGAFVEALQSKDASVPFPQKSVTSVMPTNGQLAWPMGGASPGDHLVVPSTPPAPAWVPEIAAPKKKFPWVAWVGLIAGALICLLVTIGIASVLAPLIKEIVFPTATVVPIVTVAPTEELPDQIVFVSERAGNPNIYIMNADGSEQRNLTRGASSNYYPRWSPDNHRLTFHAYPPSIQAGQGDAQLFLLDINTGQYYMLETPVSNVKFANWSPDGTRLVFSGEREGDWDLYIFTLDSGTSRRLTQGSGDDYFAAWSPDGQQIAFSRYKDENRDIFIVSVDGLSLKNLTNGRGFNANPSWSPDGEQLAFSSTRTGNWEIFTMNPLGEAVIQLTNTPGFNNSEPCWSPLGDKLVFTSERDGNREIYIMQANGANPRRLTNDDALDYNPHWR